jgi:hypothetical protein
VHVRGALSNANLYLSLFSIRKILESHKKKALFLRIWQLVKGNTGKCKKMREIQRKSKIEKNGRVKIFPI